MSERREHMARVARIAGENEARARARWFEADNKVKLLDRQRETALSRAGRLSNHELPIRLRSHLVDTGARHLVDLAGRKVGLADEAERRRGELEQAVIKVRSLDRLVERLDETARLHRRRREEADLQDVLAIRAARRSS